MLFRTPLGHVTGAQKGSKTRASTGNLKQRKENQTPLERRSQFVKHRSHVISDFGVQIFAPLPRAISPEREMPQPSQPAQVCTLHWFHCAHCDPLVFATVTSLIVLLNCVCPNSPSFRFCLQILRQRSSLASAQADQPHVSSLIAVLQGDHSPIGPLRLQLPSLTHDPADGHSGHPQDQVTVLLQHHSPSDSNKQASEGDAAAGTASANPDDAAEASGSQARTKAAQGRSNIVFD